MVNWRRPFGRRRTAAPEIKDSRAGPLIALSAMGRPRWTPRDYANLASEGFGKNAVAYRCVRMIAEAAAATPLIVFADGTRAVDHPLTRLLARPNPEQPRVEFLEGSAEKVATLPMCRFRPALAAPPAEARRRSA